MNESSGAPGEIDPIPFFRPTLPPLEEYVDSLRVIWDTRMLSNFATFSQRLGALAEEYIGVRHVLPVVSGDIGLMIALTALELPRGAPCFISDFTFNSTINAALWTRLRPVLVDIDPATFNMAPASLEAALKRHRDPGVVLPTHVFGNPCDVDRLTSLARDHECFLVFDAAHAYGSQREAIPAGNFGDAEVFSLSGTKLVTSAEGGLVATPHDWLAERVTYLRGYGFQHDYRSRYVGINGKISELHCALGLLSLARTEDEVARRQHIVARYRARLGESVGWQQIRDVDRSTYKDVSLKLGSARGVVEKSLAAAGVATKRYFVPLHEMDPYAPFAEGDYLETEATYDSTLCVPAYSDLAEDDLDRIADVILTAS